MNLATLNDEVADAIRKEKPPWRYSVGVPKNAFTEYRYGAFNSLIISLESMRRGLKSPWWATYKQWIWLQCKIKSRPDSVPDGQWATRVIKREKEGFKNFAVFSGDQVFGIDAAKWKNPFTSPFKLEYNQAVEDLLRLCAASGTLVSEIGICYLESELGIPHQNNFVDYRKYCDNWLQLIRNQPDYLIRAVKAAQDAVDHILGTTKRGD